MARRTLRDVRCAACDTVEERLVRHDAEGNPPAEVACAKCGRPARVMDVLRVNFGGTLWSQEESRAVQVFGEDGLAQGKGLRRHGDYERALEARGLVPAPDKTRKQMHEAAADHMADVRARQDNPEALRQLADNRIIERNLTRGEESRASAHASIALGRQQASGAGASSPLGAMLQNMARHETSGAAQDWGGHFADARDGVQTFKTA